MASPERYRVYAVMNFVGVPLTRVLGYMPGWAGLGMDLPKGVFVQWTGWVMNQRYLFDDAKLDALQNFRNYKGALRALCMSDDPWATRPGGRIAVFGIYRRSNRRSSPSRPRTPALSKIGHFGFFRPEHRDTLWRGAAEWIEAAG